MEQAEEALQDDFAPEQTQEIETQEPVDTIETETENESDETLLESSEPEYVDVEYDGNNYNLPPELKEALLRQSDYTSKTQEVAAQRQALETQQQEFKQASEMQQRNMQGHAQLAALQNQLQQYNNVDWNAYSEQNPTEAQKAFFQYSQLKDATSNLGSQLQQQEAHALQEQRELHVRQLEQGRAELARDISGWNQSLATEIAEYGMTQNVPQGAFKYMEPYQAKILRKAMLYDKSVKQATSKPEPTVKPISKVKGKAPSKPNPETMSTEDWMKWRNKQIASR